MSLADVDRLRGSQRIVWLMALAGSIACLFAFFSASPRFFQAYWIAWIFWSGLGFGSLIIVLLHNVSGGAWGHAVRAPAEAGAMTIPVGGLLLLPALFGLRHIFPWCHPEAWVGHHWPHKQAYLTPLWFIVRAVSCFAIFSSLVYFLGLWPWRRGAKMPVADSARYSAPLGAGGLVAYFAIMLFVSTDWIVSLEPQWYSSMFVVILAANHFLGALALAVALTALFRREVATFSIKQWHDLGNLLLAFVIFWAYVTFSQFLIIWSGNLPREISWYLHRSAGGWPHVTLALVLIQFAVPFVLLLSRAAKRHRVVLGPIALVIWAASAVHTWWLIAPSFQHDGIRVPWPELGAFAAVGGIWLAVFLGFLKGRISAAPVAGEEVAHA